MGGAKSLQILFIFYQSVRYGILCLMNVKKKYKINYFMTDRVHIIEDLGPS